MMYKEPLIDIEHYYNNFGSMVFRRCMKLLQDEERAVDAMQDVFVNLISSRERLKNTHPSSLLYRMSTNICLNIIRKESRKKNLKAEGILQNIPAAESAGLNFEKEALWNFIIKENPQDTSRIALMYFLDGMTMKEISKETGYSVTTVFNRIRDLCENLKTKEM